MVSQLSGTHTGNWRRVNNLTSLELIINSNPFKILNATLMTVLNNFHFESSVGIITLSIFCRLVDEKEAQF